MLDVSTCLRWAGPPVGIVRVECELARWAYKHANHVVFVFFDPQSRSYRKVSDKWITSLIEKTVSIDPWISPSTKGRPRRSDRIPHAIKPAAMWILQSRRSALLLLERVRILAKYSIIRRVAERFQRSLITEKYRRYMFHTDGTRKAIIPHEEFLGPVVEFASSDTLICAGAPWVHSDIHSIRALKEGHGFRVVLLCHDIIPLQFPQYYRESDVTAFDEYYRAAFPVADLVVFNARTTERDTVAYCKTHGLQIHETCVVSPGADAVTLRVTAEAALPTGIERGRYALFVSTIEPRKGHQLIYNVWLKLLAERLPQRANFKLVFVGRPGWMVDNLIDRLKNDIRLYDSLHLLTSVSDDQLATLYDAAAFCLYPSVYEGYGLPIIEAFSHNKALLASTGGAIPEVVNGFSPCLDPHDESLWHSLLRRWIVDPSARVPYEIAIQTRFSPTPWSTSAQRFFEVSARGPRVPDLDDNSPMNCH
jgi:glycosyltransferase involved in cell wall biosynthesis